MLFVRTLRHELNMRLTDWLTVCVCVFSFFHGALSKTDETKGSLWVLSNIDKENILCVRCAHLCFTKITVIHFIAFFFIVKIKWQSQARCSCRFSYVFVSVYAVRVFAIWLVQLHCIFRCHAPYLLCSTIYIRIIGSEQMWFLSNFYLFSVRTLFFFCILYAKKKIVSQPMRRLEYA